MFLDSVLSPIVTTTFFLFVTLLLLKLILDNDILAYPLFPDVGLAILDDSDSPSITLILSNFLPE